MELNGNQFDSSKPVAFFHVPKTGGSALDSAFRRAMGNPTTIQGFDLSLFGTYDGFSGWSANQVRRMVFSPDDLDAEARYISGHLSVPTILNKYPDAQLVTLLREPFSRLLSHWVYWRRVCQDDLSGFGTWADRLRLSLRPLYEFISTPSIACQTDNVAVRMLLWPHPLIPDDGFIPPEHDDELVRLALEALDRFSVVGVYEDKNRIAGFESFLGVTLDVHQENETGRIAPGASTKLSNEIDDYTMTLMVDRCRLDVKLWGHWVEKNFLSPDSLFLVHLLKSVARFSLLLAG